MKMVSLNIYAGIYLDKSIEHLQGISPDVLCLQELHEKDVEKLQAELGMPHAMFVPLTNVPAGGNSVNFREGRIGLGILSKTELTGEQTDYYYKAGEGTPTFKPHDGYCWDRALISAQVATPDGHVRVSTTHFTWTHDGSASPQQRKDVAGLVDFISKQNVDILAGDFNAPHGSEIMAHISARMDDHMPDGVTSTIDPDLHRAKGLITVVDNVFTRRGLAKVQLQIMAGLSDHKALIASFLFENLDNRKPHTPLPDIPRTLPQVNIGPAPPASTHAHQR